MRDSNRAHHKALSADLNVLQKLCGLKRNFVALVCTRFRRERGTFWNKAPGFSVSSREPFSTPCSTLLEASVSLQATLTKCAPFAFLVRKNETAKHTFAFCYYSFVNIPASDLGCFVNSVSVSRFQLQFVHFLPFNGSIFAPGTTFKRSSARANYRVGLRTKTRVYPRRSLPSTPGSLCT